MWEVLHKSRWAETVRCGDVVRKYYFYHNTGKIEKEVSLLRLGTGLAVRLYYEPMTFRLVSEMPYIRLMPLFGGDTEDTLSQLADAFRMWDRDDRFLSMVEDDWDERTKPCLLRLLREYLPDDVDLQDYLVSTRGEHFIHGDFQTSNVYRKEDGQLLVLDYENAGTGPLLWDEATLAYSLIEQCEYAAAESVLQAFRCPGEMLACIAGIRLAQSKRKAENIERRTTAYHYILRHCRISASGEKEKLS